LLKWNSGTIKTVTQKTNTMVFWLQYDNSDRDKPVRYAIADENGFESTVSFNGPYFEYDRGGFGKKKIGHARSFGLLPRRASRFYLRLYQQNSQGRLERVANFPIQNVPAKDVPNWSASPLPAAQKTNGLVFTLEKAVVGILPTEKLVPPYDSFPGQWSEFRFRVSDHGNPSSGWSVNEILISDATGNQVRTSKEDVQSLNGTFSRIELDVIVCTHRWGFWPGESAWKLRVRFEHQARLDFWAEFLIKPDFLQ
jgi:hypothetical protein